MALSDISSDVNVFDKPRSKIGKIVDYVRTFYENATADRKEVERHVEYLKRFSGKSGFSSTVGVADLLLERGHTNIFISLYLKSGKYWDSTAYDLLADEKHNVVIGDFSTTPESFRLEDKL
jgi:hypothetical protein